MKQDLQINTRVRRLFHYLEDFEKGNIQIPPFQRDFVWETKQKLELLDSIKRGYPIGSILFWRPDWSLADKLSYLESPMIGAYKLPKKNTDFFFILDGYQRLSTLFGCLINPTKTSLERNETEWKENFDIIYDLEKDSFRLNKKHTILKVFEVPLFKFIDGAEFYEFQTSLIRSDIPQEKARNYLDKYKQFGTRISSYDIPSIDLIGGSLKEAIDIFSRLNSRGQSISSDWKISALSYSKVKNFRLGTEIDKVFDKLERFNFYRKKEERKKKRNLILQCIMNSFDTVYFDTFAQNDQDALEKLARRDDFIPTTRAAFGAIEKAVKFLFEELHVLSGKLLPYNNQLIFLTDFFNKIQNPTQNQLDKLEHWFWITTYSNYFTRYNLSKQRAAYKQFQAFIANEHTSPIYYDKGKPFETADFPSKINMKSVRAKALVLFMFHHLPEKDRGFYYDSYKVFSEIKKSSENTILLPHTDSTFLFNPTYDYTSSFITSEMQQAYKNGASKEEFLKMRKENIIKHEKAFVESFDIQYT